MLSVLYALLALNIQGEQAVPLLLTGTLQSADKQTVISPMSDNWRVQVQWLHPEDQPVQRGDLIAVFDAGNVKSHHY